MGEGNGNGSGSPAGNSTVQRPVRGRPFQPGQSGNPAGRPRVVEALRDKFRAEVENSLAVIIAIRDNAEGDSRLRLAAAQFLVDHGMGRAPQAITGADGGPILFQTQPATPQEAVARLRERGLPAALHVN